MASQDLRHAFRIYSKHPASTVTVIVTLALGIGASTAIFSIVNGVLFRPLDYPEPQRLVRVYQTYESLRASPNPRLRAIWNRLPLSYLNTVDYRRESRALTGIGLFDEISVTLERGSEPVEIEAAGVDAELFEVLAVEPLLGRAFTAGDVSRRERLAILGHDLWKRTFGGDPAIVGRSLGIDGEPHTVIGVMPPGFEIPGDPPDRLWIPLRLTEEDRGNRANQRLHGLARLAVERSGALGEAAGELDRIARGLAGSHPDFLDGVGVRLAPLLETIVGDSRPVLAVLAAAVAAVLLVACANVAHLLLAHLGARRGELAIRLALGATRGRLTGQLLLESLLLALAGGALGILLAVQGQRLLLAWIPADLPRAGEVVVDLRVLAFALAASLAAALLCGLLPALAGSAAGAAHDLSPQAAVSGPRGGLSVHGALVVAEITLTLTLTVVAGLLVHSFLRLAAVDPGFRTEGLLVQELGLPAWRYPEESDRRTFTGRLLGRLSALSGVRSASLTSKLPFAGPALVGGFKIPGVDAGEREWPRGRSASIKFVTPGYFETLGIPIVEGRGFSATGRPENGRVLVVNESLAARSWPDRNPVGRSVLLGSSEDAYTVVGVAADIRHDGLDRAGGLLLYQPWSQRGDGPMAAVFTAVLDVESDPMGVAAAVRRAVHDLDPALPLPAATTVDHLLAASLGAPRSRTFLVSALAAIALVLALVGTYAVMSFAVSRQAREIGIRMALGAGTTRVRALVLRRAAVLTAGGIVLGSAGAVFSSRLLEGFLYGVEATDPRTLLAAAALLAATALAAAYLPALRASRVDPASALRAE